MTLYTRKTLAAKLVCSPRTVDNLRSKGLPHIMLGDSPRFELEPVLEWLRTHHADGTPREPAPDSNADS